MAINLNVKMGEYNICEGKKVLKSLGIGSCIAVCLYDEKNDIGGLGHVMLPSNMDKESLKYANNLIKCMVEDLKERECDMEGIIAKIFGGASLFESSMEIGKKNIKSVRKELEKYGIDIVEEDVGGDQGRSIWFHCWSGTVVVSRPMGETKRY